MSILSFLGVMLLATAVTGSVVPLADAQDDQGDRTFEGFVQSGTCEAPTDDVTTNLVTYLGKGDIKPYVSKVPGGQGEVTTAYFGTPLVPGFGVATAFDKHTSFHMVITENEEEVACGDILEPDNEHFAQAGFVVVTLEGDEVSGFASLSRTAVQRELDIVPTRASVFLKVA